MIEYNKDTCHISFREATVNDVKYLVDIERKSFTVPWPEDAFYQDITGNPFAIYMMIQCNDVIAGYCGTWLVMDEAHITNLAVLPEFRGMRLGEALLRKMMLTAIQAGAKTMTLEVRVSNQPARKLYKKLGFKEGGIRKNYYTDNYEDAIVMWVEL